ncbi:MULTISPECIES: TlpA disulfide reductase family protein [unclassified Arthrobacter]|uniref:TlpA family protein disulfide reductase n=1 Tax=unclassified Arthrobacter TaxID=235627 RepID=UPI001E5339AE|nr:MULTISPECIES: TlpA disulfide reductase family protein [unclassified Arthrobacter]MCC9144743.1 TlpA family protein disulfide reductase [Arthrobacter sp. zg-Y919]MDK1275969.1 TlpA disulfide reductase family protein [Arthrobacter sp. zg.Y919]MDM7990170.1 TlpA disulfide reductase family protein [Arthrobacter sp. zg-Y877]WIB04587.1 TlpA disulfide reductase family protein [Arthrobacter sp. zg-Y919]
MALAVPFAAAAAGCSTDDPLAEQANAGDNKNYIAGDGSVTEYDASDRGDAVQLAGTLFDGTEVTSAEWAGDVVVLNFWYAACAPCRKEAPDLVELHDDFTSEGARFYGVNIRDEKATAEAFERNFNIPYPSFRDKDGGVLLAMTNFVPPSAVPTTLVLDRQGRVAARILGLADKGTLKALISDALAA